MDITAHFRQVAESVAARDGGRSVAAKSSSGSEERSSSSDVVVAYLRELAGRCRGVRSAISELRNFVKEHRRSYVSCAPHLAAHGALDDAAREAVDRQIQASIASCASSIELLEAENHRAATTLALPADALAHSTALVQTLTQFLRSIGAEHARLAAARLRQAERRRCPFPDAPALRRRAAARPASPTGGASASTPLSKRSEAGGPAGKNKSPPPRTLLPPDRRVEQRLEAVPQETRQALLQENAMLLNEYSSLEDDVAQAEARIVEIARLQQSLSEKISVQNAAMEMVYEDAVTTTENINRANVELDVARKHNKAFRKWVFLFMLFCSLCLLFFERATRRF